MNRKESIERLRKILLNRREALLRSLDGEIGSLQKPNANAVGDTADAALDSIRDAINSQLAEMESGELDSIREALKRLSRGTYGVCKRCEGNIPIARLNALPYAVFCISCKLALEKSGKDSNNPIDWSHVADLPDGDQEPEGMKVM